MVFRHPLGLPNIHRSCHNIDAGSLANLLSLDAQFITRANIGFLFFKAISVSDDVSPDPYSLDVYRLGAKLGMDPMELLRMINGKVGRTRVVVQGLAKELDSDVHYLEKLVEKIKKDLG